MQADSMDILERGENEPGSKKSASMPPLLPEEIAELETVGGPWRLHARDAPLRRQVKDPLNIRLSALKVEEVWCKFFIAGSCTSGEKCRFSHDVPCYFFHVGKCRRGSSCRFSHAQVSDEDKQALLERFRHYHMHEPADGSGAAAKAQTSSAGGDAAEVREEDADVSSASTERLPGANPNGSTRGEKADAGGLDDEKSDNSDSDSDVEFAFS